ncbi:hypothetical protein EVAR_79233_1 [Eumeta japonica]|uniref:Uncharacterized protein n=1 Tax=Eumeta variegata TaxID=151549 RepID=A0A4C1Z5L9_EUMVA|nr:hypothetical protein EVAR_79233_1 [Eumeta japonica]
MSRGGGEISLHHIVTTIANVIVVTVAVVITDVANHLLTIRSTGDHYNSGVSAPVCVGVAFSFKIPMKPLRKPTIECTPSVHTPTNFDHVKRQTLKALMFAVSLFVDRRNSAYSLSRFREYE